MRQDVREVGRAGGYSLAGLVTAMATLLVLPLLLVGALSTAVAGVGLVLFPRMVVWLRAWTEWHRGRAAALLGESLTARPLELPKGVRAQWRTVWHSPEVRRDLRWVPRYAVTGVAAGLLALLCVGGVVDSLVTVPLWWAFPEGTVSALGVPVSGWPGAVGLGAAQCALAAAGTWWVLPWLARAMARDCVGALEPSADARLAAELSERVGELADSRAGVLDAHGAELRRIERDLHDGTQARLVAIAMRLGVARESIPDDSSALAKLLQEAHEGAEEAMSELRDVIRTMYPPILADRGLTGAVAAVAARAGVPTEVEAEELGALPAAVEAAAYFIVTESVTNSTKHSGATRVAVRLARRGERLSVEVVDDGAGGVDESRGTGVLGIRKRAAALDGAVRVSSPRGGPTAVTVELPCGS